MNESYQKKMEAQLKEWGRHIDEMNKKADASDQPVSREDVATPRALHKAAVEKLNEMRQTGEEDCENMRTDLDNRWDELREAIAAFSTNPDIS